MKKRKLFIAVLAATATLAFAGMGTGCAVKDWFDEKFNKDKQTESVIDSAENESEIESESKSESESESKSESESESVAVSSNTESTSVAE